MDLVTSLPTPEQRTLVATVGHELRTPLSAICGYLELLSDASDARAARRYLEVARRESLRMRRMIDAMSDVSLESATRRPPARCDIVEQLDTACEILEPHARRRGMVIDRRTPRKRAVPVEADACLRLILNLLENALKYGRKGGTIQVRLRKAATRTILSVDDDGPGIPRFDRAGLFDLFVRGQNSQGAAGNGIGLAIAKAIAERSGGGICIVASALGGACFEVKLGPKRKRR